MTTPTLPVFSISRLRMEVDGDGVTTLVGAYGCPLQCKYCLNPHAWNPETLAKCTPLTPAELYEKTKIDHLYFVSTGGGVVFGGGESLLHADFIREFRSVAPVDWRILAETSLNVPTQALEKVIDSVSYYIVDIKDMTPAIYREYTGRSNDLVYENLRYLVNRVDPANVKIRIPLIPNHNTEKDREASVQCLKEMGYTTFDLFSYVIR